MLSSKTKIRIKIKISTNIKISTKTKIKIKISTKKIVTRALVMLGANYCRSAGALLGRLTALYSLVDDQLHLRG